MKRLEIVQTGEDKTHKLEVKPKPISPIAFQNFQNDFVQSTIIEMSPTKVEFCDVLLLVLSKLNFAIVSDSQTSKSRTTWLSGTIDDENILIVLDAVTNNKESFFSVDVWTPTVFDTSQLVREICSVELGRTHHEFNDLLITWSIGMKTELIPQLVLTLESGSGTNKTDESIYVTTEWYELVFETITMNYPEQGEQVTFAMDLDLHPFTDNIRLNDVFLKVHIRDAEWKPKDKAYTIEYSWENAIVHVTNSRLNEGERFEGFEELTDHLGLSIPGCSDDVRRLFIDLCLSIQLEGCSSQRVSDYCQRTVVLTGLVTCFNPQRGLTGYLEMVTESSVPESIQSIGSLRTWQDHISQIVNLVEDFTPRSVKITDSKSKKQRGRPPVHLMPTIPLTLLFQKFLEESKEYICSKCKFSELR